MNADHAIALGCGQWSVWRDAALRSTGFPADGLTLFSAPECAGLADGHLRGQVPRQRFDEAFAETAARESAEVHRLACDPLVREAVTWQNRSALISLDKVAEAGPGPRRTARHRARERMIARYWQRYCGKAETVGFFGPVCWCAIDPGGSALTARPGTGMIRDRRVHFEHWALTAFAERIADETTARSWLAPALSPQLTLRGREVIDPLRPPVKLTAAQAAVVSRCDGRTAAWQVVRSVTGDPGSGLRRPDDVYLLLGQLVQRGIVRWDFDLPVSLDAERVLRGRIAEIADDVIRSAAQARLDALSLERDRVAAAAGDPHRLAAALTSLDEAFSKLSGQAATRRAGDMYAGRTLCVEETTRDLDITFGPAVLEALAPALAVPLTVTRWLCGALARAYLAEFEGWHADLSTEAGSADVPLGQLWFLAQDSFYGTAERLADRVTAELNRRWARLFLLDTAQASSSRLAFSAAGLTAGLAELFPDNGPAWAAARIHSPDLQFGAHDLESFARGEFTAVLGEMHAAWIASSCAVMAAAHPEPDRLRNALRRDLAGQAVYPLLPVDWPRHTSRLAFALEHAQDAQLGFAAAPGADLRRLVPISSVVVRREAAGLTAVAEDGRSWPLLEVFGRLLSETAVDAFKVASTGPHTPRITVDRLVLARESWRMAVADCPVTAAKDEREQYLAGRRWKSDRGLPEYVFVKLSSEVKPIFVDFTSPIYLSVLAAALRAARRDQGEQAWMVVSEMLPAPDEAWVPDADGRRYVSELRLHVRDDRGAS